jgi:hypothetical protein
MSDHQSNADRYREMAERAKAVAKARKNAKGRRKGSTGLGTPGLVRKAALTLLQWTMEGRYYCAENLRRRVDIIRANYSDPNFVSTAISGGAQPGCLFLVGGVIGVGSICPETCERHVGAIVSIQKALSEDAIKAPSKMDGSPLPGAQEGDSTSLNW